ncbi:NnrS family protein [Simplicispira suum]|uniref:NnrS family protein n=1 Tax=Simplicispira suum TaxID=2109915 RepID=UPI001FE71F3E|nr:NnrS family protein [Simplicispira suum]
MSGPPAPAKPSAETRARLDLRWRGAHLLIAPHRLAFFLAMLVLAGASLWWALIQTSRVAGAAAMEPVLPAALAHGALMVFGFFPLFFSGFLFTAGPKWLRVPPWPVRRLLPPLLLLSLGWLAWLLGAQWQPSLALAGACFAVLGMVWISLLFWDLLRQSQAEDRMHARVIAVAFTVGTVCVAGLALALALGAPSVARLFVLAGLWGLDALVFVTVAHRMLPFFSLPSEHGAGSDNPWGTLGLLAGAAGFEALAVWMDAVVPYESRWGVAWVLLHGLVECTVGSVLLWRAWGWAQRQSLRNRLLRMFFLGFVWLGLAFLLHGAARWLALAGAPQWSLGATHALGMGCLASLMLAMVTRVSAGNSGRAQVADDTVWALFCLLQAAVALRLIAVQAGPAAPLVLLLAALLWAVAILAWAGRLASWYGRLRPDGRAG